jgi:lactoylglutathione lyase
MKSIAFALDPDGYWVEIIGQNNHEKTVDVKKTDPQTYRLVSYFSKACMYRF